MPCPWKAWNDEPVPTLPTSLLGDAGLTGVSHISTAPTTGGVDGGTKAKLLHV